MCFYSEKVFLDHAYILSFSLIMLHTDAFNKSNKRKMTKPDYIKNTKLVGVPTEVLDVSTPSSGRHGNILLTRLEVFLWQHCLRTFHIYWRPGGHQWSARSASRWKTSEFNKWSCHTYFKWDKLISARKAEQNWSLLSHITSTYQVWRTR